MQPPQPQTVCCLVQDHQMSILSGHKGNSILVVIFDGNDKLVLIVLWDELVDGL